MRLAHILRSRLISLFRPRQREADLREEMQLHLDHETERLVASGLTREEATTAARRAFGGVDQIKEECRDTRGTALWDAFARDTRYASKRLLKDWPFTAAAALVLALGIGVNTAMFTAVNTALFREQPVANPARLVEIYQNYPGQGPAGSSYAAYLDIAAYTDIFANTTTAMLPSGVTYRSGDTVRPAVVEYTTASYLDVLGLHPSAGRWFSAAEDTRGAAVVVVLGHQAWQTRFNSDPAVIGRVIQIEGVPATIVGVAPAGYRATVNLGYVTDFWLPLQSIALLGGQPRVFERNIPEPAFLVKARLRDGVTVEQARAAMAALGTRLKTDYPDEDPGLGISVIPTLDIRIHPQLDTLAKALATIALVIVGLVLAIACSNIATLLLLRGSARAREISIRLAVGASRRQVIRHLLIESVLLSAAGGLLGAVLAWWAIRSVAAIDLPVVISLGLDYRVLVFATLLSLATGVLFGLAPALNATRMDLNAVLREEGQIQSATRRRLTLKNALVVFQVAISVLLLGGTSVVLQMLGAAREQRAGFAVDGVAMIETDARYATGDGSGLQLMDELKRRVAAVPGVQAATLVRGLPMSNTGVRVIVDPGATDRKSSLEAGMMWAAPGFFDVLQIPVLYGRAFDDRDRADSPRVAIVNETMARQYFGTPNPVGRRFRLFTDPNSWMEIVGVVRQTGTDDPPGDLLDPSPQLFFRPSTQIAGLPTTVVARTSLDAASLAVAIQRELRATAPSLPVISVKTMAGDLDESSAPTRMVAMALGALGALGLLLASIGLYAVVAFGVARRSREIGVRMALGARAQQVVWQVARQVGTLVGVGTGLGLLLSLLMIAALRATSPPTQGIVIYRPDVDPIALATIGAIMALVGIVAAYVPARRATRVDPLVALRRD